MRKVNGSLYDLFCILMICATCFLTSCDKHSDGGHSVASLAPVLDAASEISDCSAVISGVVDITAGPSDDYGFQYCQSQRFHKNVISIKVTDLDPEYRFRVKISPLTPASSYYYRSYIKIDSSFVYSEPQSFKTQEFSPTVPSGYENLSKSYGANCYIISRSGSYCLPAVRGNNANSSTEWLGNTKSVKVLWESFGTYKTPSPGDLVKSVCYEDGYIAFQTAADFKEGNAVIAAMDIEGTIIWSWHLWFTDMPKEQLYFNNAGVMMDRNLGATSAAPGDIAALGLLYQWGRKDPFLNSMVISSDENLFNTPFSRSTLAWPDPVEASYETGKVEFAVANPTTLIIPVDYSANDWCYSNRSNLLWGTRKTTYDPCPEGWKVPEGGPSGVWAKALGVTSYFIDEKLFDQSMRGIDFSGKLGNDSPIWYPAAGCLDYKSVSGSGFSGQYWSVSTLGDESMKFFFHYNGGMIFTSYENPRSQGFSVRCTKE